jgi:hypothetical protein
VNIQETIEGLRATLVSMAAEDELLDVLNAGLASLREAYRADRSQFGAEDIAYLRSLGEVAEHLRAFADVREEASVDIGSVEEYEDLLRRLRTLKDALAPYAVGRRVGVAMRELHARLPAVLERDASRSEFRRFRAQFRVLDLRQGLARRCPLKHPMVLREGSHGLFWGCSRWPQCEATAELSAEERAVAEGRQ